MYRCRILALLKFKKTSMENSPQRSLERSQFFLEKAKGLIPGCSQTFSKGPSQFVQGVAPCFIEKGSGSHVWDVDDNVYIDYLMALGAVILGYNNARVTEAVQEVIKKGTTFTLPHRLEGELAELLCDIIPCAEMVRFGKNGSDVTSGAVRVSRAVTGRDKIACCGYHGWQDWYIGTTLMDGGVAQSVKDLTFTFEYNNIESLQKIFDEHEGQIACVIIEPIRAFDLNEGFLEDVKKLAAKYGAVLIFDEMVTGFRMALGGAQEFTGVVPDLACFGKAMSNGFPISAVVGRRDLMKSFEDVFFSFTYGGEIASIAAAIATIEVFKTSNVLSHVWKQGGKIRDGFNSLSSELGLGKFVHCSGYSPKNVIIFEEWEGQDPLLMKSLVQQECMKRGVLFTGNHVVSYSHSDADIERTLEVYGDALGILKEAIDRDGVSSLIEGDPIQPVFRKA